MMPAPAASSAALIAEADRLRLAGNAPEALQRMDEALALAPSDAVAHAKRGLSLGLMQRWEEALAAFDRALALQPRLFPAHLDRGNVLQELGRLEESLGAYERALALQPQAAGAWSNRGTVLHRLGRPAQALESYDRALALEPRLDEARFNRATTLGDLGRHAEALRGFEQMLARYPQLAVAHWNEALCRLRLGDFARGWPKFEWRWEYAELGLKRRSFSQPLWQGREDLAGRTILLHAEQGLGDAMQFCRYAPLLASRGARIVLEVLAPMTRLARSLAGVSLVVTRGEDLPAFDFHAPLLSLPLALGTTLETIPSQVPYLHADAGAIQTCAARLGTAPRRLRVGLAWSGNPAHTNDRNRSLPLAALRGLASLDAQFVALHNELTQAEQAELARLGIAYFAPELRDFADTAALAGALDLVISVDTSVAHLAGALGLPVWILLPFAADWRWLLDRADSPWYPSARLFRQSAPGAWDPVLERVRDDLAPMCARPLPAVSRKRERG
jgi:Tfp pilus assembly protein PilF